MIPGGQYGPITIQLESREAGGFDVFFLDAVTRRVVDEASITETDIDAAKAWAVVRAQELFEEKWVG